MASDRPLPAEPEASTRAPRALMELTRAECLALLARHTFGRVVVADGAGAIPDIQAPIIRPVNYRFDPESQSIVFRTLEGSKFHSLVHRARAWFEIDGHSPQGRTGWSVIAAGTAEEITHPHELARVARLGLDAWPDGGTSHWIRIRARTVSGRRLVPVAETA